jgi:cytochrome P450
MAQTAAKSIPRCKGAARLLFTINRDRLGTVQRIADECGDIGSFGFGPLCMVLANSSDLFQAILVEHADAFEKGAVLRRVVEPIFGHGLFTSEGELWRRQRKLMAPAFQHRRVASYADTMVAYAKQAQQELTNGEVVDIGREMARLTMSIVGKALFDADVFTETDELGAAITAAAEYSNYLTSHIIAPPLSWPTPRNKRTRRALAVVTRRVQAMIDERRRLGEDRGDFLSMLLSGRDDAGQAMDDLQVRDEAMTLFLAGYDTTALALTWCFYLLAKHPEVYAQLQAEVDRALERRTPTYAHLENLPYTLQVLKETLRLYPPAHTIMRVPLRDLEIEGYRLRKGQPVVLSPYLIHRRPEYFPDPERFDPGRFSPEREKMLPRYAYVPFGAGPRICIGNHFAMMEGHLVLAAFTQHVSFALAPGQEAVPDPLLTLRSKNRIQMSVRRRW